MNSNLQRATILYQQSRYDLAEPLLRQVLVEEPTNAEAHAILSLCLDELKRYDEATGEAQQAIAHAPNDSLGHYALACVLESRNRLKEARLAISDAIRLTPYSPGYFARLGSIEANAQLWPACLAAAENGLAIDPEDVQCLNLRAMALTRLGRKEEAGETIKESLRNHPDSGFTHANEGWRLLHLGQPREAMVHFGEALRLEPNSEWARRGVIESMKARNFFYRWLLMFVLWLNSFSPRVQLILVLGLVFGQGLLRAAAEAIPGFGLVSPIVALCYVFFVWLMWVSSTLFNLILMTDRFGRLVLNRDEKTEALLAGSCVLLTGIFLTLVFTVATVSPSIFINAFIGSLMFLGVVIPLRAAFLNQGLRRKAFFAWTAGVFGVVMIHNVMMIQLPFQLRSFAAAASQMSPEEIASRNQIYLLDGQQRESLANKNSRMNLELQRVMPEASIDAKMIVYVRFLVMLGRANEWGGWAINGIVYSTWASLVLSMIPVRR